MSMIRDLIFDFARSRLFGPKDFFERQKKRLLRSMILPLFLIIGTPSVILSVLSSIQFAEVNFYGSVIKFIGAASVDVITLSISVFVSFAFTLGCNLYYASHIRQEKKEIDTLEASARKEEAFCELLKEYRGLLSEGDEKAIILGKFIFEQYPDLIKHDSTIVMDLIKGTREPPQLPSEAFGAEAKMLTTIKSASIYQDGTNHI